MLATLKSQYQNGKSNRPDNLNLRLHRALSWLEKAQNCQGDLDMQFISLWIAFNAIYAKELSDSSPDRASFESFLGRICQFDKSDKLYHLIWDKFTKSIRTMLDNRYVFAEFWAFHNGKISPKAWQEDFETSNKKAYFALANQDTDAILRVVFSRLYVLRNQIVHGGATYGSSVNREQLKDGCQILSDIIPVIIQVVLDNDDKDWGKPFYPVVD
ncbi:hypothetical protein [Moraxella marmotae]|uniref:hypothetical protein n=1 Tax=Moraxella marmotae TaxID=3344520 RepID=UPI0035F3D56B